MIIHIVNQVSIPVPELEDDPVVPCYGDRPETRQFTLQRVEVGSGIVDILDFDSSIQDGQDIPDLFHLVGTQLGRIIFRPEQLQSLMLDAYDHTTNVTCYVTDYKYCFDYLTKP